MLMSAGTCTNLFADTPNGCPLLFSRGRGPVAAPTFLMASAGQESSRSFHQSRTPLGIVRNKMLLAADTS